MLLPPPEADALLDVLKRRPVFRDHPELVELFGQLTYKRFMGDPEHFTGADQMTLARHVGGVLALNKAPPPADIVPEIVAILDRGQTYLLMCDDDKDRQEIARQVDAYSFARTRKPVGEGFDGQHRSLGLGRA